MADSGSILTKSGELSEVTNWYYEAIEGGLPGRFKIRFQIAWANTQPPDVLLNGSLRLAGKRFQIFYIYQVCQWDKQEIEVYCHAFGEERK